MRLNDRDPHSRSQLRMRKLLRSFSRNFHYRLDEMLYVVTACCFFKLMLNLFHTITVQGRELNLR